MEFSSDDDTEVDGVGLYLVSDASSLDGAERSSKPEDDDLTMVLDASRLDGAERSSKPEDDGLTMFVEITLVRWQRRIFCYLLKFFLMS